jgi:hypothetical protein
MNGRKTLKVSMRGALAVGLLTLSTLSFTQMFKIKGETEGTNQSFIFFDNGEVSTTRSYFPQNDEVKLFDVENLFFMDGDIKESRANYFVTKDNELYTIDAHGYVYQKEFYSLDSQIKHFGGNYFITRSGHIHIVKNDGVIINYEKIGDHDLSRLKVTGGNYFITKEDKLITINYKGYYADKTSELVDDVKEIEVVGNNYFILKSGVVYTIGTEMVAQLDANGNISYTSGGDVIPLLDSTGNKQYFSTVYRYESENLSDSIVRSGGNYYFDVENNIHTISANGTLNRGAENRKLKVNLEVDKDRSRELPVHFGNNYFVYADGAMYMVDRDGYYYFVKALDRRVSKTNYAAKLNKKKLKKE